MWVGKHRYPWLTHALLIVGIFLLLFPVYIAFVASTHTTQELLQAPLPLLPGHDFLFNYLGVLRHGVAAAGAEPIGPMLLNSLIMALMVAVGKVALSFLAAYAIVYFRFPFQQLSFWLIFLTLMLPVEVRIVPTFLVVARLDMLNSYWGLSLPLLASATATFLFRQFFMTLPDELLEAAKIDGAGPWRFLWDVLLPLSKTNLAALMVIMFIYGWNQFLWPLVATTEANRVTIVMGIQQLSSVADQIPQWNMIMAVAMLAMLPPVLLVLFMQRWFVKGLVETEK